MKKDTLPTSQTLPMKQKSMNKEHEILNMAWDLLSENEDVKALYGLCLNVNHITFMGRVGEGVIAPIKAKTKNIRVYRDELTSDFLVYGNLSKEFGLNYHFFGNEINKWNPHDDDTDASYTDLLVLQFEDEEQTIIAVDKYKHLTKEFLLIYNTKNIYERLEVRLKGFFEVAFQNGDFQNGENFTVFTKTKS